MSISTSTIPLNSALDPDQLKQLADVEIAQAACIAPGDERLRRLALAEALTNLAEIKKLLLDYERRLFN